MLAVEEGRAHAHRLDGCLAVLEELNERGVPLVPAGVAAEWRPLVPGIAPGMRVDLALDLVFDAQEAQLRPRSPSADVGLAVVMAGELGERAGAQGIPMTRLQATELTNRIRHGIADVCLLLMEAHDRAAWIALDYGSWNEYVRHEFGISRSRSYQLLDQARVSRALSEAAGLSDVVTVTAYAAADLKPHLPELVEEVRRRSSERVDPRAVISTVVERARANLAPRNPRRAHGAGEPVAPGDLTRLAECIAYLHSLPVADVAQTVAATGLGSEFMRLTSWVTDVSERLA